MKNNLLFKGILVAALGCTVTSLHAQPCSGVPNIGGASATDSSFNCSGMPELNLTSFPAETGITYQWQASPGTTNNFTDVGPAHSSPDFTAPEINGDMDYRVIATCNSTGGGSVTSNVVSVTVDTTPAAITMSPLSFPPLCAGSPVTFTGMGTGAGVTYQWLQNDTIITDGGLYSGVNTTMLTISDVSGLDNSTYSLVAYGCNSSDTTTEATLMVNSINTWTGDVNNLWSEPGNWSCDAIPVVTSDVVIPAAPLIQPTVDITDAIANTVTIDSGAILSILPASALELKSTITENGVFDASLGKVILSGTDAQNIPGGIYYDLTIDGGSTKVSDSDVTVVNILNLMWGYIQIGNNDLILAAPDSTLGGGEFAFISTNDTGVVTALGLDATDSVTFHVGLVTYNPLGFRNNGVIDDFSVRVTNNVYEDGVGDVQQWVSFPVINRTWMISEAIPGGSDVTLSPYWYLPGDAMNGFDNNHVYVIHHNGTEWESLIDSTTMGTMAMGSNPYYTTATNVTDFSPFSVGSGNQFPLTIKLSDIAAVNIGSINKIDWQSASEAIGDKYELERSTDGKSFTAITTIPSKGEAASYTYRDMTPVSGINFYRAKLIDANGKFNYSKVVSATVGGASVFSVQAYPNPVGNTVSLNVSGTMASNATAMVTDMTGRVIKSVQLTANNADIDMSGVAPGIYFIKYADDAHQASVKINKQ